MTAPATNRRRPLFDRFGLYVGGALVLLGAGWLAAIKWWPGDEPASWRGLTTGEIEAEAEAEPQGVAP